MAYKVLIDGATVLKSLGEVKNPTTGEVTYEHVATVYPKGAIIKDEDVSPVMVKLLEDGDEHVNSVLEKTGDEPTEEDEMAEITSPPTDGAPGRYLVDEAAKQADVLHEGDNPDEPSPAEKQAEEEGQDDQSGLSTQEQTTGPTPDQPTVTATDKPAKPAKSK
jgi:hypothetical protein